VLADARRHGRRRAGREQVLRRDGRGARREDRAGAARGRRGQEEARTQGPPVAGAARLVDTCFGD
jgi:hypothetical protein